MILPQDERVSHFFRTDENIRPGHILWDLSLPAEVEKVRDWIDGNRYVRELTCEERETYRIEPLCEE